MNDNRVNGKTGIERKLTADVVQVWPCTFALAAVQVKMSSLRGIGVAFVVQHMI